MLLCIDHETRLTYSEPVAEHVFEVRMAPLSDDDQTGLGYRLRITPSVHLTAYRDGFGNRVDLFNLFGPAQEVTVQATSYVRTQRRPAVVRLKEAAWPSPGAVAMEALEFLQFSPLADRSPEVDSFLATLPDSLLEQFPQAVEQLMAAVHSRLKYEKKVTSARTPVSEALTLGRGVCQDFAHLFLTACRGRGLPARYVSGYVNQPGEIATHAWVQVWAGSAVGWVDVDPTRQTFVDDGYVVIAVGRDFSDVPPNRGAWKGSAEESIAVSVKVETVQRLPGDWIDLERPQARSLQTGMQSQQQRQQQTAKRPNGLSHQSPVKAVLRHQKSQQQQGPAALG